MSLETPQKDYNNRAIKEIIGKPVVDPYGWAIGKVIGASTNSQNTIQFLGVELNNGEFTMLEGAKAHQDQNAVIINSSWRTKAEVLTSEIATITRRISALSELDKDVEISEKVHADLQNRFENEKKTLLEQRRSLSEQLKERIEAIDSQLKQIQEFIANLKISYKLREIDEETYQRSYTSLQLMANRRHKEESDVKFALDKLTANLLASPPEPLKQLPPSRAPQLANEPIKLRITE